MEGNSCLSLALHALSHMANDPDRMRTSAEIADHDGTNPVVVRRILGKLREAELLTSEKGHAGGWKLAHLPQSITLADVYLALDERLVSGGDQNLAPSPSQFGQSGFGRLREKYPPLPAITPERTEPSLPALF